MEEQTFWRCEKNPYLKNKNGVLLTGGRKSTEASPVLSFL